jgi:hypothetical protein
VSGILRDYTAQLARRNDSKDVPDPSTIAGFYALDATIDVPAVGQSPPLTRAAVEQAMAGKIRAKGSLVGLFKRQ